MTINKIDIKELHINLHLPFIIHKKEKNQILIKISYAY